MDEVQTCWDDYGRTLVCCQKETMEEVVVEAFERLEVVQAGVGRTWVVEVVERPF